MRMCSVGRVLAAVSVLGLTACEDLGLGSDGQPQDRIVFLSDRDVTVADSAGAVVPPMDIFVMDADGGDPRNLTRRPDGQYEWYSVSASGKIAFHSYHGSDCSQIYVMNPDGTGLASRTTSHCNFSPRWSPDGSRLAYLSYRTGGATIVAMNASGTGERDVSTSALSGPTGCPAQTPAQLGLIGWAPGNRVVFHQYRCTLGYYFFIAGAEGGAATAMPFDPTWAYWSPDGSRVALVESGRLTVMNADGSGKQVLTPLDAADYLPPRRNAHEISPWSPDGTHLVFTRRPEGGTYVINVDGSGLRRLPVPNHTAAFNGWSPRGTRLAFTIFDGNRDVYVVNADGTGLENLTRNPADDRDARWIPAR